MAFEGLGTIGQIHVSVDDLDKAIAFYRDVLGLRFLFRVDGQEMAFFDCDGVRLYLGIPESEEYRSRGMVYFSVPDIDEAFRAISDRGVEFVDEPHLIAREGDWQLRMAFFRDPDGNNLALMEETGGQGEG